MTKRRATREEKKRGAGCDGPTDIERISETICSIPRDTSRRGRRAVDRLLRDLLLPDRRSFRMRDRRERERERRRGEEKKMQRRVHFTPGHADAVASLATTIPWHSLGSASTRTPSVDEGYDTYGAASMAT